MSWEMVRLGDVCERIIDGSHNPPQAQKQYTKYIMLSSKNVLDGEITTIQPRYLSEEHYIQEHARTQVCTGDVLLTIVGTIGRVALVCENWDVYPTFQRSVAVLRPKEDLLASLFLMYSLRFIREILEKEAQGNSQKGIYLNQIENITIPLPPLNEQRRIAAEIERQFAAVEKAKKAAEEQIAAARKLNAAYLQEVFANIEGKQTRLGDVCVFEGGSQPPKNTFKHVPQEGYIRLIQIQDYRRYDMAVYIPEKLARKFCRKDDVMIGRYGPPVFQILRGLDGAYNVALMKAYSKDSEILDNGFLFYLLQEENMQSAVINQSQRSAGQTGVDKSFLERLDIVLPSISTQLHMVDDIERHKASFKKMMGPIQTQLDTINAMPAAILRQAFSGQMREEQNSRL